MAFVKFDDRVDDLPSDEEYASVDVISVLAPHLPEHQWRPIMTTAPIAIIQILRANRQWQTLV
jgi:hypothetical protein